MEPRAPLSSSALASPSRVRAGAWVLGLLVVLHPAASSALALGLGGLIALTLGNPFPRWTRLASRKLLAASIVALGAGVNLAVALRVGLAGLVFTVAGLALALAAGTALARLLGVARTPGLLISIGTAICGGSAIAATAPVLGATEEETSVALGTVFLLNAVALFLFPPLGHLLGLTPVRFGLWAALGIHDTSSVVGAALRYGPEAVGVATTVKLARALWIFPLALGLAWNERRRRRTVAARPAFPVFLLLFLAMAALFTGVPALAGLGRDVSWIGQRALVATLFLIGSGLTRDVLRNVGPRSLLLGVALWAVVGTSTLWAVERGWTVATPVSSAAPAPSSAGR